MTDSATDARHPVYDGPVIDAHTHFDGGARDCAAVVLADPALPGTVVNFWDLRMPPPSFQRWAATWSDAAASGMALLHMPDLTGVGRPDFERALVAGVEDAHARGAAGIKLWKNLGLTLADARGRRVAVDDPRLGPLWDAAARLRLPVAIHVGDPPGFFEPVVPSNERYHELREHPEYWFGDTTRFPRLPEVHEQFERLVRGHPRTTFVGLHFGCFMELADVARMLAAYPNYLLDTATRTFDLGREPMRSRALEIFACWPERILFGTDLIRTGVYDLPAAAGPRADARAFYAHHWRLFETGDRDIARPFAFLPDEPLHGLELPPATLRLLYHDNAARTFSVKTP